MADNVVFSYFKIIKMVSLRVREGGSHPSDDKKLFSVVARLCEAISLVVELAERLLRRQASSQRQFNDICRPKIEDVFLLFLSDWKRVKESELAG